LSGSLFCLFLHIFTLKFVKYDSIFLILRKKSAKNTPKNQAKLVLEMTLNLKNFCYFVRGLLENNN